jgi:hypothetical protein
MVALAFHNDPGQQLARPEGLILEGLNSRGGDDAVGHGAVALWGSMVQISGTGTRGYSYECRPGVKGRLG